MENYLMQITNYLLTQSWQIAVLVAVIAAVNLALKNKSAHVRYLLWLIVLAKCLVPPLLAIPLPILPQDKRPELTLISNVEMPAANVEMADTVTSEPIVLPSLPVTSQTIMERLAKVTARQWLGFGWIVGVAVFLLFAVIKALRTDFWLWRQRKLLPAELQTWIENLFSGLGIKALLKVWLLDGIGQPFVWGLLRGSIYLPADFVKVNCAEHRRGVLGHELGHILRFDAAVNILQIIAQAIFWFHPFVWWANRKIRAEREKCCDEMAIASIGAKAKEYCNSIVNILIAEHESTRPVPSLAVAGPVKNIEERIKTMMKPGKKFYKRPSLIAVTVVLLLALLIVPTALVLTARAETRVPAEREDKPIKTLHQTAADGDIELVKSLISKGADVNEKNKNGLTPLLSAASEGHAEIVKSLLENGAKVDANDSHGYTALFYAIWSEDKQTVRNLISSGANVNLKPKDDFAPLFYAVWQDQTGIVGALLDAGANAELEGPEGWSPLQFALEIGNPGIVTLLANTDGKVPVLHKTALRGDLPGLKELLGKGADLNEKDGFDRTPVYYALAAGQGNVAKFLLDQGADISLKTRIGRTLLHQASRAGLLEIVQILLARDMPADTVSGPGHTPLHEAAGAGHKEIAELLLTKGAPVDSEDRGNRTPLHMAAGMGETDIVELLIAKGADVNASDVRGRTPLTLAKQGKHTEVVNILRQHGATETLHGAVTSGDIDEVKRLISQGADINVRDKRGQTPLHQACSRGRKDMAELLIAKGADVNIRNDRGQTSFHVACSYGHKDIAEHLIAKGVDINSVTNEGGTPLVLAAYAGHKDIVELLISKGSDIEYRNIWGNSPLSEAAYRGKLDVAKFLLEKGAEVDSENYYEDSPLHRAIMSGHKEMVEMLLANGASLRRGRHEFTPIVLAMLTDQKEMVRFLIGKNIEYSQAHVDAYFGDVEQVKDYLAKGGDINGQEPSGLTLLACAICGGQTEVAEFLLGRGPNVNMMDGSGFTALQWASAKRRPEVTRLLVEKGADVRVRDNRGRIALHWAAMKGDVDIVERLIQKGSDVNARSGVVETRGRKDARWTPLHQASAGGHKNAAGLLFTNGADINAKTNNGDSALSLAKRGYDIKGSIAYKQTIELLRKHGAKE